jgi:hypothetical protein
MAAATTRGGLRMTKRLKPGPHGDPGSAATRASLELYLGELKDDADPRGESAFVREEVIRRIAALRLEE